MRKISQLAMEKAAQAWCMPETEKKTMDVQLCCEFAKILDAEMWKPSLGCATTKQLLDEIAARSNLDYQTMEREDIAEVQPAAPQEKYEHGAYRDSCLPCHGSKINPQQPAEDAVEARIEKLIWKQYWISSDDLRDLVSLARTSRSRGGE